MVGVAESHDPQVPDPVPRRQDVEHRRHRGLGNRLAGDVRVGKRDRDAADLVDVGADLGGNDGRTGEHAQPRVDIDQADLAQDAIPRCRRVVHGRALWSESLCHRWSTGREGRREANRGDPITNAPSAGSCARARRPAANGRRARAGERPGRADRCTAPTGRASVRRCRALRPPGHSRRGA